MDDFGCMEPWFGMDRLPQGQKQQNTSDTDWAHDNQNENSLEDYPYISGKLPQEGNAESKQITSTQLAQWIPRSLYPAKSTWAFE